MKNFKGRGGFNDRGGDRGGFGGRGGDRGNRGFGGDRPSFGGKPRFGGKPGFGSKPGFKKFGDRRENNGDREMFSAVCSGCGKTAMVPFRPSGDKPVFCDNCFTMQKETGTGNFAPKPRFEKSFDRPKTDERTIKRIDELTAQVNALATQMKEVLALVSSEKGTAPKAAKKTVSEISDTVAVVSATETQEVPVKKAPKKVAETKPAAKKAPAKKVTAPKASAPKAAKKAPAKKAAAKKK